MSELTYPKLASGPVNPALMISDEKQWANLTGIPPEAQIPLVDDEIDAKILRDLENEYASSRKVASKWMSFEEREKRRRGSLTCKLHNFSLYANNANFVI